MIINIPDDWTPTAANINALPKPVREYIMRLSTDEKRAGLIAKVQILEGQLAAVNRMVAERQWQPIETAPKDGTMVLGHSAGEMTTVRWDAMSGYWELVAVGAYAEDDEWIPDQWMPLPEAPA